MVLVALPCALSVAGNRLPRACNSKQVTTRRFRPFMTHRFHPFLSKMRKRGVGVHCFYFWYETVPPVAITFLKGMVTSF